jgi:hypothetical protein
MESRFGWNFGDVRIHDESEHAGMIGAAAFTIGRNIAFAPGQPRPDTAAGEGLLAHELAHVVQQDRGAMGLGAKTDAATLEREADAAAAGSGKTIIAGATPACALQRKPAEGEPDLLPTTDRETAARRAAEMLQDNPRLSSSGGAIEELFARARNRANPVLRRASARELSTIDRLLRSGTFGGREIRTIHVVPSSNTGRTPDLAIDFTDGSSTHLEQTTLTSAPGGRVTVEPQQFEGGKLSRGGLVNATNERSNPAAGDVVAALRRKGVGPGIQVNQPVQGRQAGGTVSIDVVAPVDPAIVDQAVRDIGPEMNPGVDAIEATTSSRNADGHLTRTTRRFERAPDGGWRAVGTFQRGSAQQPAVQPLAAGGAAETQPERDMSGAIARARARSRSGGFVRLPGRTTGTSPPVNVTEPAAANPKTTTSVDKAPLVDEAPQTPQGAKLGAVVSEAANTGAAGLRSYDAYLNARDQGKGRWQSALAAGRTYLDNTNPVLGALANYRGKLAAGLDAPDAVITTAGETLAGIVAPGSSASQAVNAGANLVSAIDEHQKRGQPKAQASAKKFGVGNAANLAAEFTPTTATLRTVGAGARAYFDIGRAIGGDTKAVDRFGDDVAKGVMGPVLQPWGMAASFAGNLGSGEGAAKALDKTLAASKDTLLARAGDALGDAAWAGHEAASKAIDENLPKLQAAAKAARARARALLPW